MGSGTPTTGRMPADHAGVDEYINKKTERDGAAGQAREGALRLHGQVQTTADHDAIQ